MAGRPLRDSIKSYFGNHIDNEKAEEQENNRTDVENKKMKIIELIKEVENDEGIPIEKSDRGSEIVNLVEDIHQQYESLHSLYNQLTGELRRKAHYKEKIDGGSSSSSSSDSESDHSSKVKISKNHIGENDFHKQTESLKHELGATNQKLSALSEEKDALGMKIQEAEKIIEDLRKTSADLNQKLGDADKEKQVLSAENLTALIRIEEGQKIVEDLRIKADQLKEENGTLNQELETVKEEVLHLNQQLESANSQVATLISLNKVLGATQVENNVLASKNSEILVEIEKAQAKMQELTNESKQLKEILANRENELSALLKKYSDLESETLAERKGSEAKIADLRGEFNLAGTQERELKQQIESGTNEAIQLKEEISTLQVLKSELQDQILVLERKSNEREEELTAAVNNLQLEVDSLRTQKSELEEQLKAKSDEAEKLIDENSQLQLQQTTLQEQVSALDISLKLKEENALTEVNALREQVDNLQHELIESKDALRRALENENMLQERLQVSENEKTEDAGKKRTKFGEIEMLQRKQRELLSEISRLRDEQSNAEVTLRLLNRRLVVTEQSLNEREHNHRQAETYFHQERNSLLERITQVTEEVGIARRELRDIKECIAKSFNAFTDLEVAVQSSMVDQASNENRILKFSEELQNAKKWVTGMNNENEKLKKSVSSLVEELGKKKEQELALQKKVENLKVTVDKEHKENERMWNKVEELEKNVREMKEITICREEEKREAIRQLCLWVDYRTENYDRLKQTLSHMSRRD